MKTAIEELMWSMHRGESEGVLVSGFRGEVRSLGEGISVAITTEAEVNMFNLGVQAGVKAALDELAADRWVLTDRHGRRASAEVVKGKAIPFNQSYNRWHNPTPNLQVIKKETSNEQ